MMKALIVDSREPEWVKRSVFDNITPMIQTLPAGDAWIACADATLVVERKTLSDLVSSIADGRLFNQCAEMVKVSPWAYLLVCGLPVLHAGKLSIAGKPTDWTWASIQGALLTVQDMGVAVEWLESEAQYGTALIALSNRSRATVRVKARRDTTAQTAGEIFMTSLPGIGQDRAQALLTYAENPAWALAYLTWDDDPREHIPGIGPTTRQAVRAVLGLRDDQIVTINIKEDVK